MICTVFLMGIFFSMIMSSYRSKQKQQLEELVSEFKGQRGKYEQLLKETKELYKWKYRVKIAEKVYYIFLICLSFVFYKNPSFFTTVFITHGQYSISGIPASIIIFNAIGWYLDRKYTK
mmetsp:Transcript_6698/g.10761  ORF Transcript_6698/g.10761 Transcript_6698/m.10761 type:complete len:119 (-) Transcript_6698:554-910(-)